jgi:hypothetical protein
MGGQDMLTDKTAHRGLRYLELRGGLRKCDLAPLGARALAVRQDLSVIAQKNTRAVQPLLRAVVLPAGLCRLAMALSDI